MKFTFDNNTPIYIQIVQQLKLYIISGKISSGERLPSVRVLALDAGVNPNTMQKALTELEDMGLVCTERTNGKYVTADQGLIDRLKDSYAEGLTVDYLSMMEKIGINAALAADYLSRFGGMQR